MRLFLALPLSWELKNKLDEVQSQLKKFDFPLRWVNPEVLHITLQFLGEVDEKGLEEAKRLMTKVANSQPLFVLRVDELTLITPGRPRVLALNLSGEIETFLQLQRAIQEGLYWIEDKRLKTPHITLARIKRWKSSWGKKLEQEMKKIVLPRKDVKCGSISLMQSTLTPEGPTYKSLQIYKLPQHQKAPDFSRGMNGLFGLSVRGFGTPRGVSHCGASKTRGKPRASARGGSHSAKIKIK